MRSSNPFFNEERFYQGGRITSTSTPDVMTAEGAANKTGILLALCTAAAVGGWVGMSAAPGLALPGVIVGAVIAFVLALVVSFKPTIAPVAAPIYAVAEGVFLGGISRYFEQGYPGIASGAVTITFVVFFAMLALYRTGVIRVTETFRMAVVGATLGIFLFIMVAFGMSLFGARMPLLNDPTPMGIALSLLILGVAALNLALDFDFIDEGAKQGLPKYMEWYAAFGLLVTLAWVYFESLRLLRKLQR